MAHQSQPTPMGNTGRRLHIAHRRSPSELTPLMLEQLAIAQQIEVLQQQQQQIAAHHHHYLQLGMMNSPNLSGSAYSLPQNMSSHSQFQLPHLSVGQHHLSQSLVSNSPQQSSTHRRNHSALPGMAGVGPPPAPSSGSAGLSFSDFAPQIELRENVNPRGRGSGSPSHIRRHSLALPEAKKAAELAEQKRKAANFQFPAPVTVEEACARPQSPSSQHSAITNLVSSGTLPTDPARHGRSHGMAVGDNNKSNTSNYSTISSIIANHAGKSIVPFTTLNTSNINNSVGNPPSTASSASSTLSPFQFPSIPSPLDQTHQSDFQRASNTNTSYSSNNNQSGHGRSGSRNFEGNWRQQSSKPPQESTTQQIQHRSSFVSPLTTFSLSPSSINTSQQQFQPTHRSRGSLSQSIGSIGNFQYQPQPSFLPIPQAQVMLQSQLFSQGLTQPLNPLQLAQLQALQVSQLNSSSLTLPNSPQLQPILQKPQSQSQQQKNNQNQHSLSGQQQQKILQQQRKTLFTPYLAQAVLPDLLLAGQLVSGILRVNKKNRSDAYLTCIDVDADIFICGSKDRNRALEGDIVAVELLDVDEVWNQKREKEEKKKRKDNSDHRRSTIAVNDATTQPESASAAADSGLHRRGSLKQRPTQKKNDDVEVEGQSLLLSEEDEINDNQKPLYAGHIVAVIERTAGQMFSGTLGLLRPSSQATKEKQEAERAAREGGRSRPASERLQEKPKIVWFKPTDKRVPLIAIPTEQAPRDFVERHKHYANRIFVACIKRWPITSLHPFGTLVEQLGEMGNVDVETDALLRDNNFGNDTFSDSLLKSVGFEDWSVAKDSELETQNRRDFRSYKVYTIDPNGYNEYDNAIHVDHLNDGMVEIGFHVSDVSYFIKNNSPVDREAKKRGTAVYLTNKTVHMLPRFVSDLCSFIPEADRYAVTVVFKVDPKTGIIAADETWVGKSIINTRSKITYSDIENMLSAGEHQFDTETVENFKLLQFVTQKFRAARFGDRGPIDCSLRLLHLVDDENIPIERNIFNTCEATVLIEELRHKTNAFIANLIFAGFPHKALLRRQSPPNYRRLETFAARMNNIGIDIDTTSSGHLQHSLFKIKNDDTRKGVETLLIKSMSRARYVVASKCRIDMHPHYALNLPLYTHFTSPLRRYADLIVHRQLEAVLSGHPQDFAEEIEALSKTANYCNTKKDSALNAQEQNVHNEACLAICKKRSETQGELICTGIVLCVYESAFDVLIPEWGYEKRVHCDQLPLKKAEFDKNKRILELYWLNGVPSSSYIPEDEQPRTGENSPVESLGRNNRPSSQPDKNLITSFNRFQIKDDSNLKFNDTHSPTMESSNGLYGDDDNDNDEDIDDESLSDIGAPLQESLSTGIPKALTKELSSTMSSFPNPSRAISAVCDGDQSQPMTKSVSDVENFPEADRKKYLEMLTLREENGRYIQEIKELTRVPVLLRTDLTKSPSCLTIRSLNPFAL